MEIVEPIRRKVDIDMVKTALKKQPRDFALFVTGINSGLRISDLLQLRIGDVTERGGGRVRVAYSVTLREKKTGKSKSFPLNTAARSALRRYLDDIDGDWRPDKPLFKSRKGGDRPIGRVQAYRILTKAAKAAGLRRIGTHTLRKTFGYWAYKDGVDVAFLQKILNHRSQEDTLRYIGILQDDLDNVYRKLNL